MSAASGFNDDFLDMLRALVDSGADLAAQGIVYQLGLPPRRIDLMTSLSGVDFDDAWSTRVELAVDAATTSARQARTATSSSRRFPRCSSSTSRS